MAKYGIADYLTTEEKQRILDRTYDNLSPCSYSLIRSRRDSHGYCPLGVVLGDPVLRAPSSYIVMKWLVNNGRTQGVPTEDVAVAAFEFTYDWDRGVILNLREALGMAIEETHNG